MKKLTNQKTMELVPLTSSMTQEEMEDEVELRRVMNLAREDFNEMKSAFKFTEVEFLAAFLKGYQRGLEKGDEMFKELNKETK